MICAFRFERGGQYGTDEVYSPGASGGCLGSFCRAGIAPGLVQFTALSDFSGGFIADQKSSDVSIHDLTVGTPETCYALAMFDPSRVYLQRVATAGGGWVIGHGCETFYGADLKTTTVIGKYAA